MPASSPKGAGKMEKKIAIADLVNMDFDEAFNEGNCYGFYDWFCKDKSLKGKAKVLFSRLKGVIRTKTTKFDPTKTYVFFKNNCPGCGKLYDDFRICDIETGDVLYTISPSNRTGKADVYGVDNDFEEPLARGTWNDVLNFFNN